MYHAVFSNSLTPLDCLDSVRQNAADYRSCSNRYNETGPCPAVRIRQDMHLNLKYLLLIRSIAIGGQVLALVFMQHYFSIKLPLVPVIIIISLLGLFTIISWHRFQNRRTISEKIFFTQLMMDVSALTTLIYFTGG